MHWRILELPAQLRFSFYYFPFTPFIAQEVCVTTILIIIITYPCIRLVAIHTYIVGYHHHHNHFTFNPPSFGKI